MEPKNDTKINQISLLHVLCVCLLCHELLLQCKSKSTLSYQHDILMSIVQSVLFAFLVATPYEKPLDTATDVLAATDQVHYHCMLYVVMVSYLS